MFLSHNFKMSLKKNLWILYLWNRYRVFRDNRWKRIYTDEYAYAVSLHKKWMGEVPNLLKPTKISEKYLWLKLFYRNPNMVVCADKYQLRLFLKQHGYEDMQTPLAGAWDSVEDIDFSCLPEKYVLKSTNGSGTNLFCLDKTKTNYRMWKKIMNCWMKQDISIEGLEWPYHHMTPKIICEKYLETNDNNFLDYKFLCLNGKMAHCMVVSDRFTDLKYSFFTRNWEKLDVGMSWHSTRQEERPAQLEKMIAIAEDLASDFPAVRVDFYQYQSKLIIGEMTFFDAGGRPNYQPLSYDEQLGSLLTLPEPNHNLELYHRIHGNAINKS